MIRMKVKIEENPLTQRLWREWISKERELSRKTKEERERLCEEYQWIAPKTKKQVDLESLFSSERYQQNRKEFKKWFYVICGYLFSRIHFGDNSYHQYRKRYKKVFQKETSSSKVFPLQVLLVLAILGYIKEMEVSYSYTPEGRNNHGYQWLIDKEKLKLWYDELTDMEKSQTSTITFDDEVEDKDRISWSMHPDWLAERQYQSISSAEVLDEGIKTSSDWLYNFDEFQNTRNLTDEESDDLMKEWVSYQKLRDLSRHDLGACKDDSDNPDGKGHAGRFYSPMVFLDSELRHKHIRLDGELVTEVDVSSAQPTFLGLILFKNTGIMTEWLRQALDGHFYEWIQDMTNTPDDRKQTKIWMMHYMYSCFEPQLKKTNTRPHKPTYEFRETDDPYLCFQQRLDKFLKVSEPSIYKVIDWYKRNPEYRDDKDVIKTYVDKNGIKKKHKVGEGQWCSNLSYDLVKMEVEYMKTCIKRLPEDMKFWTIHDCLCVKESDSLKVKEIMEGVSREMYEGLVLNLKRENTSVVS